MPEGISLKCKMRINIYRQPLKLDRVHSPDFVMDCFMMMFTYVKLKITCNSMI